jgi:hypothetical protein
MYNDMSNKENKEMNDNASKESSENSLVENPKVKIEWSPENELIMIEWCDVAQCYKWLNSRAHSKYSYMHAWFTIPAIIFSTVSGTASFAQSSIPANFQAYAPLIIGTINICIGILTTIQQYLKISELNEAHRVSSIAWDKFARNIRIELSKHPDERTDAKIFIKICRQEFDRLMETSPDIKDIIIKEFNDAFTGKEGTKQRKRFDQLRKPDICDTIISADETRHKWYRELEIKEVDEDDLQYKFAEQRRLLEEKEKELTAFVKLEDEEAQKQLENLRSTQKKHIAATKLYKEQTQIMEDYISTFEELYDRRPLKDEIIANMTEQVDEKCLDTFLATYMV